MDKNSTIENLLKTQLENRQFDYSELLWNKLDAQLLPVRDAYNKKEKRRVIWWWSAAAVVASAIGGTVVYNATEPTANTLVNTIGIGKYKMPTTTANSELTNATIYFDNGVGITGVDNILKNGDVNNVNPWGSNGTNSSLNNKHIPKSTNKPTSSNEYLSAIDDVSSTETTTIAEYTTAKPLVIPTEKTVEIATEKPTVSNDVKNSADNKTTEAKPSATKAATKKVTKSTPAQWYATTGLNIATPINNPSYFVGGIMQKQIDDKQFFVGVKVANNKMQHQLVSTEKANTYPQVTDAVIEKMTTIQIPFGYSFKLNKNNSRTLLNLGFEPTILTGVSTVYYDDNGVVGGPRTAVKNSALLKNAINKFNISFIAGVQLPITKGINFTSTVGYGLVNITDKQYYNKSIKNNNLKYIQAGLLLRIK